MMMGATPEAGFLLSELGELIKRRAVTPLERMHALSALLVAAYFDGELDRDQCYAMLDIYFDDCERWQCQSRHGGRHLDA
jgi:hypothetical protein